jgi:xylulokinase
MASRVKPGSDKLIFTPWLNGERTPVDSTTLRGSFYNISLSTTADHFARAVLEGVAYNTRWSLKYVERFIGRRMDTINIIGGGAISSLWCQIFADVFDRRIRQVKDPIESNARGAAFIASAGLGFINFEDIPNLIKYENVYDPDAKQKGIYDELFNEFVNIYKKNRGIFKRLNKVQSVVKGNI